MIRKILSATTVALIFALPFSGPARAGNLPPMGIPLTTTIIVSKPAPGQTFGDQKVITFSVDGKPYKFVLKDGYVDSLKYVWPDIWEYVRFHQPNLIVQGSNAGQIATASKILTDARRALYGILAEDEPAIGLRIASAVWRFWEQRGHLAEGRRTVEVLLALLPAAAQTRERALGLTALAGMAYWQSDFAHVADWYGEAERIHRALGDRDAVADATYNLAFPRFVAGDLDGAREQLQRSREMYRALGDDAGPPKLGDPHPRPR